MLRTDGWRMTLDNRVDLQKMRRCSGTPAGVSLLIQNATVKEGVSLVLGKSQEVLPARLIAQACQNDQCEQAKQPHGVIVSIQRVLVVVRANQSTLL